MINIMLEIEHCDYSCSFFLEDISKVSTIEMKKYLDIFLFQIICTLLNINIECLAFNIYIEKPGLFCFNYSKSLILNN